MRFCNRNDFMKADAQEIYDKNFAYNDERPSLLCIDYEDIELLGHL